MTEAEIRAAIVRCLESAVPGADVASLDPAVDMREQLDMDSMDLLRFVRGVHEALHVDIPDVDNRRMTTLDGAVAYVQGKLDTRA